jgi:arylsulfatase A-like enzyme
LGFDLALPKRGSLILEAHAELGGRVLTRGVARWGDPILVPEQRSAGRNLVLVVIDTLRADELGAYGGSRRVTPNLDALAERSVRFAQLHSPAPWTLPSMASLMTGLQPQTHGAGRRFGKEAPGGLAEGFTTLAERLAGEGFYTSGVYKNIYLNPEFGLHQGFDLYASHEVMPLAAGETGTPREADAQYLVDRAIEELRRIKDRRFFLYVHLFDPHNPYEAPEDWCKSVARRLEPRYAGQLGCRVDRRPENPLPPVADFAWIRALYDAEVAYTDHELGRFFSALETEGLNDSTVLAVASDHGEEFYGRLDQEQRLRYDADSDHGHSHYEELLHVPGLIAIPGVKPGVVEDPVQTADLFPTLLSALGVANRPTDPPLGGAQDLLAAVAGGARPQPVPLLSDVILHGPPRRAIRRGPWKLIVPMRRDLAIELYNLAADPQEVHDIAKERPDVVAGLRTLLHQAMRSRRDLRSQLLPRDNIPATYVDWAHIAKLRSLGYLR